MNRTTPIHAAQRTMVCFGAALGLLSALGGSVPAGAQSYTIRGIAPFGGNDVEAFGINANGIVVGRAERSDNTTQPYLWGPKLVYGMPTFAKTDLGTPLSDSSAAYGINTAGDVVGKMHETNGSSRAFLYTGGQMHLFSSIGTEWSEAHAINNAGQIVGRCDVGANGHAFLYSLGADAAIDLTPQLSGESVASAINNAGQIVGTFSSNRIGRGFVYQNGARTDLPAFANGGNCEADAINDDGVIAGAAYNYSGKGKAVRWVNGTLISLSTLGGDESGAYGINNAGQIVGWSDTASGQKAAFLWKPDSYGGTMINLNSLLPANSGWQLFEARAINDNGQIAGTGIYNGEQRAFRLSPIQVKSVTVTPSTIVGGNTASGRVYLLDEAPVNITVYLQSDFPYGKAVPTSVTIPAGSSSASFTVTTSTVTASTPAAVQARVPNGVIRYTTFTVVP